MFVWLDNFIVRRRPQKGYKRGQIFFIYIVWAQTHWEKVQAGSKEKKKEKESKASTEKIVSKHKEQKIALLKLQTDFLLTHDKMQVCVCVYVCVCVCVCVCVVTVIEN